jgi:hypothetical protein
LFLSGVKNVAIRIDNSTISDRAWGDVDKAALARRLAENGDAAVIREAFAYVPDLENRSEWGGPHHELQGDTLVVNRNGVHALAAALSGARGGVKWPRAARVAALAHVRKHYKQLQEDVPEGLGSP